MAHIVVVDDFSAGNRLTTRLLEEAGHTVTSFTNPEEALNYMQEVYVDMLVTDLTMPQMDGFELCQYIRQYMTADEFPIMILTARYGNEDRFKGYEAGANAYVTKPVTKQEFTLAVEHLMGHKVAEEVW